MPFNRDEFASFIYEGQKKYGRIRVIESIEGECALSLFVYQEWKLYKRIAEKDILEKIPTVHNKNDLKSLNLHIGSKVYFGSYISAEGNQIFTNRVDYPLRWTVIGKDETRITLLCDWIVECCQLSDFDYYLDAFNTEAFSIEERSIIKAVDNGKFLLSDLCIPDLEDVIDDFGQPKSMDSPYIFYIPFADKSSEKVKVDIDTNFQYWLKTKDGSFNVFGPYGLDKIDEEADAVGFLPKLVIEF